MTKELKTIEIPEGWVIDFERSTDNKIILREVKSKYPLNWKKLSSSQVGYYINTDSQIIKDKFLPPNSCENTFPEKDHAEAALALPQLIQLRNRYWEIDKWNPKWLNQSKDKFCIEMFRSTLTINNHYTSKHPFCFKNRETAEHFMKHHKELLEIWFKIAE